MKWVSAYSDLSNIAVTLCVCIAIGCHALSKTAERLRHLLGIATVSDRNLSWVWIGLVVLFRAKASTVTFGQRLMSIAGSTTDDPTRSNRATQAMFYLFFCRVRLHCVGSTDAYQPLAARGRPKPLCTEQHHDSAPPPSSRRKSVTARRRSASSAWRRAWRRRTPSSCASTSACAWMRSIILGCRRRWISCWLRAMTGNLEMKTVLKKTLFKLQRKVYSGMRPSFSCSSASSNS